MSPSEQNQGWNAANTELGGQVGFCLGIDLGQPDPGFELARRLLELRAIILHGPHQGAQKSTNSGRSLRSTWRENVAVVNSMGSPVNKGCWQRPQLGCSDSFAVGTRLMDWQCGQTR